MEENLIASIQSWLGGSGATLTDPTEANVILEFFGHPRVDPRTGPNP